MVNERWELTASAAAYQFAFQSEVEQAVLNEGVDVDTWLADCGVQHAGYAISRFEESEQDYDSKAGKFGRKTKKVYYRATVIMLDESEALQFRLAFCDN